MLYNSKLNPVLKFIAYFLCLLFVRFFELLNSLPKVAMEKLVQIVNQLQQVFHASGQSIDVDLPQVGYCFIICNLHFVLNVYIKLLIEYVKLSRPTLLCIHFLTLELILCYCLILNIW